VASTTADAGVSVLVHDEAPAAKGWLVGPWFDALFIANIAWPLLLLLQFDDGFNGEPGIRFWQLYFITTPHRWITLAIVFLDGERLKARAGTFLAIAAGVVVFCVGVQLTTGALTCLMAIDYVWNAWHFASQHHGIYGIYGRLSGAPPSRGAAFEKWTMRGFLLYVILRIVSATWSEAAWTETLAMFDWFAIIVPVGLVAWASVQWRTLSAGRVLYLVSMLGLYSTLLWAVHQRRLGLVLILTTASALFHAVEYLALVSWSVQQRHEKLGGQMGALGHLVPRWGIALAVFVVVLGAGAWFMDQRFVEVWLLLNVMAAFLHYAYDGLIWRRRATA